MNYEITTTTTFSTLESARESLAMKIDSKGKFENFQARCRYVLDINYAPHINTQTFEKTVRYALGVSYAYNRDDIVSANWWIKREYTRMEQGIYRVTEITQWLNKIQPWACVHVSKDDPTMMAYTIDAQGGENDRQVRVAPGRLIRKLVPILHDNYISKLEQAHLAELDTSFKLATTEEEIERVYTEMEGDSGCMRHHKEHWGYHKHPSAVYAGVPGLGVAYLEDSDGTVTARSVVYVNPADPSDKRYVRIYGAPILQRKLEANGYKLGGLAGVTLHAIPLPQADYGPDYIIMPYLDQPGGPNCRVTYKKAVYGIRQSYHEVRLLTEDEYTELRNMDGMYDYPRCLQSTSARQHMPVAPSMQFVDILTGNTVNRVGNNVAYILTDDGRIGETLRVNVSDLPYNAIQKNIDGRNRTVLCSDEAKAKYSVPGYPGIFNDEDTRAIHNIVKLDEKYYGADKYYYRNGADQMADGSFILASDVVIIYDNDCIPEKLHKSEADAMIKAKTHVRIHSMTREFAGTIARVDNSRMVKTVSGRKVLLTNHADVCKLWTGAYEFSRNAEATGIYGRTYYHQKSAPINAANRADFLNAAAMDAARYRTNFSLEDMFNDALTMQDAEQTRVFLTQGINVIFDELRNNMVRRSHFGQTPLCLIDGNVTVAYGYNRSPVQYPTDAMVAAANRVMSDTTQAYSGTETTWAMATLAAVAAIEQLRVEVMQRVEQVVASKVSAPVDTDDLIVALDSSVDTGPSVPQEELTDIPF